MSITKYINLGIHNRVFKNVVLQYLPHKDVKYGIATAFDVNVGFTCENELIMQRLIRILNVF